MLSQYSVPTLTQSNSQTDITAAVTGGVVTVVLIITTAVTVIVIVVLLLRNRRGHYSPGIQRLYVIIKSWRSLYVCFSRRNRMSAVDITAKSNEAYELTKISGEPIYCQYTSGLMYGNMDRYSMLAIHCLQ